MGLTLRARRLALAILVSLHVGTFPFSAHADLVGGDVVVLSAILTQAVAQTGQLTEQVTQLLTQIELMRQMLSQVDPRSFAEIQTLLTTTDVSLSTLTSHLASIGYTLTAVEQDFQTVFPKDLTRARYSDFDPLVARWQSEILDSAHVAARAQASLASLQANTNAATSILARSAAASGQVGQLQSVVQMLGVLQGQTNTLITSLDAAGRVTANMAAASASEKQLSREKKRRNLAGYTNRGVPVPVFPRLP